MATVKFIGSGMLAFIVLFGLTTLWVNFSGARASQFGGGMFLLGALPWFAASYIAGRVSVISGATAAAVHGGLFALLVASLFIGFLYYWSGPVDPIMIVGILSVAVPLAATGAVLANVGRR